MPWTAPGTRVRCEWSVQVDAVSDVTSISRVRGTPRGFADSDRVTPSHARPPRLCLISRSCNRQLLISYVGLQVVLPHAPLPNSKRCFSSHKRNLAPPSLTLMCYSLSLSLGMARYVDPLVVGRVIGDVVDLFVPTVSMTVRFGSKHVSNGCDIKPSMATNPPTVQIAGQQSDLYTLVRGDYIVLVPVMTDPDAPSPSDPTMREWLHWMMVNMPGGTYPSQGV
ncbi:hypothetical protein C4D60_Mb01t10980 [Musa balbisiana]|uniref:Uncharacterized protein n=1 Tax=Musa balbisiana TaxID=52838 RepID=A0A4S8JLN7_MUSBA|nr:hypothetical protein C4D60_Mb01t10980 [Musa balbisiana]